jgi:ABC-type multidrug transport system fused ATPase/permease subunit
MSKFFDLKEEGYDRIYSDRELFSRIIKRFEPHSKSMTVIIIFIVLNSVCLGLIPWVTNQIFEQMMGTSEFLFVFILVILVLNLSGFFFNFIVRSKTNIVAYEVCYKLRRDSNMSVLNQDLSFFDKYPTGKIVSRINSDGQKFGGAINLVMQTMASLFILGIVIIPMFVINTFISIVLLIMVPIVFLFTISLRKIARKKMLLGQRSLAQVNAFIQESMSGIQIAKTFRQEKKLMDEFEKINAQSYKVNMGRALFQGFIYPCLDILVGILFAILIFTGGNAVIMNLISSTDLYLFFQSSILVFQPLFQLANFWTEFQQGMAAGERMFSLMDATSGIKMNSNQTVSPELTGKIEFNNLNFQYISGKPIFQNLSLTIQSGESVAIVGHTGAGKTSLARLLLRLYEFQSEDESLKIDDISIRDLDLGEYRRKVGYIPQTPFLWDDSIENNVKYGSPDATKEDVIQVLKQTGSLEWIEDLDDGLNTHIMERGKLLSIGQRQLVAFARVLLQDPKILILDEATASVDPFTETKIQKAMEKAMEKRTTIIIAHRLVTVRHVDRIIVLDHGRIIEQGNHDQLMKKQGYYAELYNTYFRHQSYEFLEEFKRII